MPIIPKPEAELKRPRKRKGSDQQATVIGERRDLEMEWNADPEWHDIAQRIFNAAKSSGQSDFYQDSDWAMLYSLCEDISYYKSDHKSTYINKKTGDVTEYERPRSGQMLQAILSNLASLLLTEGERRKVRMELQQKPEAPPNLAVVAEMSLYRDAFGA